MGENFYRRRALSPTSKLSHLFFTLCPLEMDGGGGIEPPLGTIRVCYHVLFLFAIKLLRAIHQFRSFSENSSVTLTPEITDTNTASKSITLSINS